MANYPQLSYDTTDTELYKTNAYSGTDADLDNTAPVSDADGYTSTIDLTSKLGVIIDFKFLGTNGTDDLVLKLYRRRNSTWDGDEILIDQKTIDNDGTEDIYSYSINSPGYYRFSLQSAGGTTTFDIDVECRYWRYIISTS